MSIKNPCLNCGACCAFFRVSFFWGETDPSLDGQVPPELTEQLDDTFCCMKGTNSKTPRCVALEGGIGKEVHCRIYALRSNPCRDFGFHDQGGFLFIEPGELNRCNEARNAWGLPPLHLVPPVHQWKNRPAEFHRRHLSRMHVHSVGE